MGEAGTTEEFFTFDQLLRQRAVDSDQAPLIAYPKTRFGISDYELVTGATLNRFVDGAAKALLDSGFPPVYEETVIGIYSLSDLDYFITILGLGRLGYTPFMLSPRLPASAVAALLTTCKATTIFLESSNSAFASSVREFIPDLISHTILTRTSYDSPEHSKVPLFERGNIDLSREHHRNYLILHSSGSTGLPKPITWSNKRVLVITLTAQPHTAFQSVPFSHTHGFGTYVQAIYARKTLYIMNGHVPQTHDTVTKAIKAANPEIVWTVPYVLKLLVEKQEGIDVLKRCKIVNSSGSRCPDDLGDLLVKQGVHLGLILGSSETASLFSSLNRVKEDKAWNYMSPQPHAKPYLLMRPVDDDVHEAIVLDGHKGKTVTNSNDPPNSYHTSDLFVPHPVLPDRWKFVGRLDDRITLLNGEKVLPLPIEGLIRQHALVKEAVMFGIDRPVPGLLLFRSKNAEHLNDEEFLNEVWPVVQEANSRAEGFSQISKEMVVVIGDNVDCPVTDKSSIKRAQIYREFAIIIEESYSKLESGANGLLLHLSLEELEAWIGEQLQALDVNVPDSEADLFASGVDSLKAIQMRSLIIKTLDLGGVIPASMIVYDCGNTKRLAEKLYRMRIGEHVSDSDGGEIDEMKAIIEKYSTFKTVSDMRSLSKNLYGESVVVLTGATGFLGSHLLTQLTNISSVKKIYCLVRTSPNETATGRLTTSLKQRQMATSSPKIIPLSADLSKLHFNLSDSIFEDLKLEATHVIHCAWEVNFSLSIRSFGPQIQALHNLLTMSMHKPKPAHLIFCSSIGTAMETPNPALIPSARIPDLYHSSVTGYARSKLVGERVVEAATKAGANATILRIGQIVPARNLGSQLWNPNEALPLMIRTASTLGVLPDALNRKGADSCTWLEADTLARSMLELSEIEREIRSVPGLKVYNLVNPRPFSWKLEMIPALKTAGLEFEVVKFGVWLGRVRAENDPEKNPSRKLLGFWEEQEDAEAGKSGEVVFETLEAEALSEALRSAERVVDGDMVGRLVKAWQTLR